MSVDGHGVNGGTFSFGLEKPSAWLLAAYSAENAHLGYLTADWKAACLFQTVSFQFLR